MSCGACWASGAGPRCHGPYILTPSPCTQVTANELRRVLGKRRGSTLSWTLHSKP